MYLLLCHPAPLWVKTPRRVCYTGWCDPSVPWTHKHTQINKKCPSVHHSKQSSWLSNVHWKQLISLFHRFLLDVWKWGDTDAIRHKLSIGPVKVQDFIWALVSTLAISPTGKRIQFSRWVAGQHVGAVQAFTQTSSLTRSATKIRFLVGSNFFFFQCSGTSGYIAFVTYAAVNLLRSRLCYRYNVCLKRTTHWLIPFLPDHSRKIQELISWTMLGAHLCRWAPSSNLNLFSFEIRFVLWSSLSVIFTERRTKILHWWNMKAP